jgi:hypothetical protein
MDNYPQDDLKLIYRVLHCHLAQHPELLDSLFFEDLQHRLHKQAGAEGVDVSDHGAWDEWLGNVPVSCEKRVAKRAVIR